MSHLPLARVALMLNVRKWTAVLLAMALAAGLASCGEKVPVTPDGKPVFGTPIGKAPAAFSGTEYTFAFMGDTRGNNAVLQAEIREAAAKGCAFEIYGGDMTESGAVSSYIRFGRAVVQACEGKFAVYPAVGNHDLPEKGHEHVEDETRYRAFFGPGNYTFRYGPDAFVVIDDAAEAFTAQHAAALETALSPLEGKARNVFLVAHVPPRNDSPHGAHSLPAEDGARLVAVAKKHKVTMMLCSHEHAYAETKVDGVPLVISGGAGAKLEAGEQFHWVKVTVKDGGVTVEKMLETRDWKLENGGKRSSAADGAETRG